MGVLRSGGGSTNLVESGARRRSLRFVVLRLERERERGVLVPDCGTGLVLQTAGVRVWDVYHFGVVGEMDVEGEE